MKGFFIAIVVFVFALSFAQIPVFIDQYQMRLEGHLAESEQQVRAYEEVAALRHKTLDEYIARFLNQADPDFHAEGQLIRRVIFRAKELARAREALVSAHPIFRPIVFVRYVDQDILNETWQGFTPGLLITAQLAIWAGVGALMAFIVCWGIRSVWASVRPQKR